MLHFQCNDTTVTETGHRHETKPFQPVYPGLFKSTPVDPSSHLDKWDKIIQGYARRCYSKVRDRLPGISGMAKRISDLQSDKYLAGVWASDLPYALLWLPYINKDLAHSIELEELIDTLCDPSPYIAPSWSPVCKSGVMVEEGLPCSLYLLPRSSLTTECAVLDARTSPVGRNPFGEVSNGVLRIQGRLARLPSDMLRLECFKTRPQPWYLADQDRIFGYCCIDWEPPEDENEIPRGELWMLLLASAEGSDTSWHDEMHDRLREQGLLLPDNDMLCDRYLTGRTTSGKKHASKQASTPTQAQELTQV